MPASVYHSLTATTPDDPAWEIRPSHWNSLHAVSLSVDATEISGLFSNKNGVSFGLDGTNITASVVPGGSVGTVSAGTASVALGQVVFSNSGGVSFGLNGSTITAVHNGLTSQSNQAFSASGGSSAFQTLAFNNANGFTFSNNAGSIEGSYSVPSIAGLISAVNVSAGTTSNNLSAVTFANANNVAFGMNGSVVTASASGSTAVSTVQGVANVTRVDFSNDNGVTINNTVGGLGAKSVVIGFSVETNYLSTQSNQNVTAGNGGFAFQTLSFSNVNGFSFGTSAGSAITGSYTVPTVTNSSWSVSDAGSSGTVARLAFTNLNGVTLSLSTGANGSHTIVGSHNGLTTAMASNRGSDFVQAAAAFNGTNASGTIASNAISVSVAAQTNQTIGLYASSNTTLTSSGTADARSLSFRGIGAGSIGISGNEVLVSFATVAAGAVNFSAGTTSSNLGSVVFSNSNGVSFGLNGATITASANAGGGGTGSLFAQGNTTQNSSTTQDYSSMQFGGRGAASVGFSNGTVQVSVPNTSSLVGASGISLSTNGSTITIARNIESMWANLPYFINSQTQTVQASTSVVWPLDIECELSVGFARMLRSVGLTSTSFASTANAAYTYNYAETHNLVLYSQGTGANSASLRSVTSTSVGLTMSVKMSRNTTNNISVTHGFSYPVSNGTSSTSFSYAATNSTDQFSSTHLTALTAAKLWDTQFAVSLDANQYWAVYGISTNETTQTTNLSGLRFSRHTIMGVSQINSAFGMFDAAANASLMPMPGCGSFSTAGGGTTNSIPFANVSSSASHVVPFVMFQRNA